MIPSEIGEAKTRKVSQRRYRREQNRIGEARCLLTREGRLGLNATREGRDWCLVYAFGHAIVHQCSESSAGTIIKGSPGRLCATRWARGR